MGTEGDQFDSHDHSLKDPTRILALTDGVFAIIMTLLVLELKVPSVQKEVELSSHLLGLGYHLLLYFASFLLAGVYWVGHRLIFSLVKHVNTTLVWLNIFFLMICSLIPFAAALLGNYPFETYSLAIYGALLFLLAGFRLYMYLYVTHHHSLLYAPVPHIRRKRVIGVMIFAPVMFLLSLCIVPFFPKVALVLYCVTPPMFVTAITLVNKMKIK